MGHILDVLPTYTVRARIYDQTHIMNTFAKRSRYTPQPHTKEMMIKHTHEVHTPQESKSRCAPPPTQ